MGKYVGIDLGTTYSAIAYIDSSGKPVLIPNEQGAFTTPSTILFGEKETLVGAVAKTKSSEEPKNYEAFAKRHMGEKSYIFTTKEGQHYSPEQISAIILKKLKSNAEAFMGEGIDGAVITVPAYFADSQRQATKDAAKIAGIPVLDIINEPTAAAIAFGVSKDIANKQKVLIYDFGGGTFDISILEIDADSIRILATGGDHQLGGYDIDKRLVDLIVEVAKEDQKIDICADEEAMQELWLEVENCKKELSASKSTILKLYVNGKKFSTDISRDDFEIAIDDIVDASLSILQKTLDDINLSYKDLDKILLVGGTTRIPLVKKMIMNETGIEPSAEIHPDEAVAIGAAYHAIDVARRQAEEPSDDDNDILITDNDVKNLPEGSNYEFTDITSHGVGVVVWDDELDKAINSVILKKNTSIPVSVSNEYSTVQPFQESIRIQVTQGENENLDYCTIVGDATVKLRPREYQVPIKIVIGFDANAIIHVRAIDLDDNSNLGEIAIDRSEHNLTEEQFASASSQVNDLNIG